MTDLKLSVIIPAYNAEKTLSECLDSVLGQSLPDDAGMEIIVINDGRIDQRELKRLRMSVEELMEELRQQDVFSFLDVLYAIVETNGKLSVLKKPDREIPTLKDLGLSPDNKGIEAVVISDGSLSDEALELCGADEKLIDEILKKKELDRSSVFIMTMNKKHEYNIVEKERQT